MITDYYHIIRILTIPPCPSSDDTRPICIFTVWPKLHGRKTNLPEVKTALGHQTTRFVHISIVQPVEIVGEQRTFPKNVRMPQT